MFKLVTFSAALADGLITPDQRIDVPASLQMGTYTFHDAESHGNEALTASQILAQSSNLGTIEIAQRLGENPLLAQISNLGFGHPTGLNFPGESEGLVPGAGTWTGTSIGSTPIGQDDAVTAQQILDAYNAVANGGVFVAPRLVRGTVSPVGRRDRGPPVGQAPGHQPDHRRRARLDARRGGELGDGDRGRRRRVHGGRQDRARRRSPTRATWATSRGPTSARSPGSPRHRTRCCRRWWSSTIPPPSTVVRWPRRSSPPSWPMPSTTTAFPPPRRERLRHRILPSVARVASRCRLERPRKGLRWALTPIAVALRRVRPPGTPSRADDQADP